MSKGSPVFKVRLPPEELRRVLEVIDRLNFSRKEEPYNVSSFLRSAITARLLELERQARYRKKRGKVPLVPIEPGALIV